jgi:hypothetical protein
MIMTLVDIRGVATSFSKPVGSEVRVAVAAGGAATF